MSEQQIKSVWDGWEKQFHIEGPDTCTGVPRSQGGECALTFLHGVNTETLVRVGNEIQKRYMEQLPEADWAMRHPRTNNIDAIVCANNILKLTPEQFRELDRVTQVAEAVASAERQMADVAALQEEVLA